MTPPTSDSDSDDANSPLPPPSRLQLTPRRPISTPSPHPFAGSFKANRSPPSYEKKLATPPATPPDLKKHAPWLHEQTRKADITVDNSARTSIQRSPSVADSEQRRWDATISSAVDKAETKLDLSSSNLTYIPPSIIDLKNLVVLSKRDRPLGSAITPPRTFTRSATVGTASRAFTRSTTAPALLPSPPIPGNRPFLPSHTTNALVFGAARQREQQRSQSGHPCQVELYLMGNAIRTLPRELFALDCLVVLSLRQNKLTCLPPAIGQLTRLRELNIASNRLRYLPAEILQLRLTSLQLHPNQFMLPMSYPSESEPTQVPTPESKLTQKPETQPTNKRKLGPLTRGPIIPKLSELILRVILAPAHATSLFPHVASPSPSCSETRLEAALTPAQIEALPLPEHIQRIIRASTGHARAAKTVEDVEAEVKDMDPPEDVSRNMCPNPLHRQSMGAGRGPGKGVRFLQEEGAGEKYDAPVFGTPVEERMEWVGVVAGVKVAHNPNAWIPVLWRGCGRGCLAFLEGEAGEEEEDKKDVFEVSTGEEGEEFEFSDDE